MCPSKISLGIAALSLGTALAAMPALAQTSGDPGNGVQTEHHMIRANRTHLASHTSGQRTGSVSNEQSARPGGNTYAFGAQGQPPAAEYHYSIGRAANDGGMNYSEQSTAHSAAPTGSQRTGSASNEQASAPGGNIYAYGGQGQPPGAGFHYPVGRAANDGGMNYGAPNTGTSR
jgi:hypothetical protein